MKPQIGIIVTTAVCVLVGNTLFHSVTAAVVIVGVGGCVWVAHQWHEPAAERWQIDTVIIGFIMVLAALGFWLYLFGNPLDELALIRHGRVVGGVIVDAWEDADDGPEGGVGWTHGVRYQYLLPDGREFTQVYHRTGRLKDQFRNLEQAYPIEVEYLPEDPAVSRIRGNGHRSVMEWLLLKVGLGGLYLVLFVSPGVTMLHHAASNMKRIRKGLAPMYLPGEQNA